MKRAAIALAIGIACTLAAAQAAPPAASAAGATFVCGGVGEADQDRMKSMAGQYDMKLTFAVSTGAYAADVDVEIRNSKGGVVLSGKCDGPIMLVDFPAGGSWRVTASYNGQAKQKTISTTNGKLAQATFVWAAGGNS